METRERDPVEVALDELWSYMEEYGAPETTRRDYERAREFYAARLEGEEVGEVWSVCFDCQHQQRIVPERQIEREVCNNCGGRDVALVRRREGGVDG